MSTPAAQPDPDNGSPGPRPPQRAHLRLNQGGDLKRRHAEFERLCADNYEPLKARVLSAVRAKLAGHNISLHRSDLEGFYNQAWHGLYVRHINGTKPPGNLGGFLATVTYRRAIDDLRQSHLKHPAAGSADDHQRASEGVYEPDFDGQLIERETVAQLRSAVEMALSDREWNAFLLCDVHQFSRREAADVMGVSVKRLDKIVTELHQKLGEEHAAIVDGQWCREHRSLMIAFALGLLRPGGKREAIAIKHIAGCLGCAAYVRSLRDVSVIAPLPVTTIGVGLAGGGIAGSTIGVLQGGAATGAGAGAAGAGTTGVLGGLAGTVGGKAAVICVAMVCVGGGGIAIRDTVDHHKPRSTKTRRAHARPPAPPPPPNPPPTARPVAATKPPPSPPSTKPRPLRVRPIPAQSAPPMGPESGGDPSAPPQPAPTNGTMTFGP